MFGIFRKMVGIRNRARSMMRTYGVAKSDERKPHPDSNMNFERKFDATDEDLAKVRELNESDLYSDGSSGFSRMDLRRQDGGDTESLAYPHAPDLKGKGSRSA